MRFYKKKKVFLFLLLAFFAGTMILLYLKISQPLNLIIISSDTLRADHMSVYGYKKNTTPNINKWAENATIFTNAKTMIPFTLPSFVSLMTGKSPFQTTIYTNFKSKIPKDVATLADVLKSNGYETAAFVTNYVLGPKIINFSDRFDIYTVADYYYGNEDRYKLENLINEANKYIQNNKNKKIFVWIHIIDPHAPYNPPQGLKCMFNDKYCDFISKKTDYELGVERIKIKGCRNEEIPEDKKRLLESLYDAEIYYMDRLVGSIIETIKNNNLDSRSLILFYGDHGEGMDHDFYFAHGEVLYNSLVKNPLIIKYPSIFPTKKKVDRLITNTDIFPTLLDLLKTPMNKDAIDGISFKNELNLFFQSSSNKRRETIYYVNNYLSKFAIEDTGYKYIYSLDKSCLYKDQKEELYNQQADPDERNNMVNINKKMTDKLKNKLLNFIKNNKAILKFNTAGKVDGVGDANVDTDEDVINRLKSIGY